MADLLKTYSVLIAWDDDNPEQGDFGWTGRAANFDEAEERAREAMAASSGSELYDDPCGGRVIEITEGAIWKAVELEAALRRIMDRIEGKWYDPEGDLESDIAGVARPILAEIDAL